MTFTTLISTAELFPHLQDPDWAIVDCRFSLAAPHLKEQEYLEGHIQGAVYAHLDRHLSAPVIPGQTGRHPLPELNRLTSFFSEIGIDNRVQVVAYDDAFGALAAGRLWWLLRWLGHPAVAVMDGGWQKWGQEHLPVKSGRQARPPRQFIPHLHPERVVDTQAVLQLMHNPARRLFDARTAERYRGENETIDPVAGHIPGALSAPYLDNIADNGLFRSKEELRQHYQALFGRLPAEQAVFYCGSGVTAAHDILAVLHAGLGEAKLYAGSWSEWITSAERPVEVGEKP